MLLQCKQALVPRISLKCEKLYSLKKCLLNTDLNVEGAHLSKPVSHLLEAVLLLLLCSCIFIYLQFPKIIWDADEELKTKRL